MLWKIFICVYRPIVLIVGGLSIRRGRNTINDLIKAVRKCFIDLGVPLTIKLDNEPQFTSKIFRNFLRQWEVHRQCSSPYYPTANGLAEASVKPWKLSSWRQPSTEISTRSFLSGETCLEMMVCHRMKFFMGNNWDLVFPYIIALFLETSWRKWMKITRGSVSSLWNKTNSTT